MNYFLDTNVKLGYVFCTDPWNRSATNVFDFKDKLHYSQKVDDEFQRNFHKFLNEQKQFFYKISEELKDLNFKKVNFNEFNSIGLAVNLNYDFAENKKESCLKKLWDICNRDNENHINVENLVRKIRTFARNFEKFTFNRKINFEQRVIMCLDRVEDYSEIFNELDELGIHKEDNAIILDAHDLAFRESLILNFVTADNDVYKLSPNVEALTINKFLHLKNF